MRSRTRIAAHLDDSGVTRLIELAATAPISARPLRDAVYLVASAAGPLGGDDVEIDIEVGPGARLVVVTNAASVALAATEPSRTTVHVEVGAGATFEWLPEPLVVTARADHEQRAIVRAGVGAVVRWREEIVFGRTAEHPGRLLSELAIDVDGRPIVRQAIDTSRPGSHDAVVTDGRRALGTLACVAPDLVAAPAVEVLGDAAAWFDLEGGGGAVVSALGDVPDVRLALDAALTHVRCHTVNKSESSSQLSEARRTVGASSTQGA